MNISSAQKATRNESEDRPGIHRTQERSTMKLLIATVALATVIAVPALAQSTNPRTPAQRSQALRADQVQQYGRTDGQRHSTSPANDVYDGSGLYIGSDPDSRIRHSLPV